jgi:cytochrome c oxidase assembly protein subunit 15
MTVAFLPSEVIFIGVDILTAKSATIADRQPGKWLNHFAWLTAVATLLLVCSGGMVTSKGYGLAVPDWPTTFGYNMFLFPVSKWIGGVFFEHTHRLAASTVGLLTIVLAAWLWRGDARAWVRNLGLAAVAAVILQGILGGLRVTMLRDQIGIFHACLAQAFLGLLVFIALITSPFWRRLGHAGNVFISLEHLAMITTVAIYLQLALGATMRHQHRDLAIRDFPTANGAWLPDTSPAALEKINAWRDAHAFSNVTAFQIWLQMVHRFVAALIALGVIAFAVLARRVSSPPALLRLSMLWAGLLLIQLALGAWTIWSNKAADVATTHVAVGATLLSLGIAITAICSRLAAPCRPAPEPMIDSTRSLVA